MRADSAAWDRAAEVRAAAAGWRRASTIDDATFAAIEASFPDPCVTPTWIWRALTACLATAIGLCTLAAVLVATEPRATGLAVFLWLFAAALVIATERMEASPRHARRGAAGATSFWAVVLFLLGLGLLLQEVLRIHMDTAIDAVLLAGVVAWGAGAWRWGSPVFAGLGAVSLFLFLGRMPHARILWGVAGVALAGLAERRLDAPSWAPSPRRAAAVLAVAGVAAVYAALNYYSLDENLLENLRKLVFARAAPRPAVSAFSTVATAVIPLGVLAWGIRSRRRSSSTPESCSRRSPW